MRANRLPDAANHRISVLRSLWCDRNRPGVQQIQQARVTRLSGLIAQRGRRKGFPQAKVRLMFVRGPNCWQMACIGMQLHGVCVESIEVCELPVLAGNERQLASLVVALSPRLFSAPLSCASVRALQAATSTLSSAPAWNPRTFRGSHLRSFATASYFAPRGLASRTLRSSGRCAPTRSSTLVR